MKKHNSGFTLIEMMLVTVVVSLFMVMGTSYMQQRTRSAMIDRASVQMMQILNAGLSYYVSNGSWPANLATLQAGSYLPTTTIRSPWGTVFTSIPTPVTNRVFTVSMSLPSGYSGHQAIGQVLAGKLPFGVRTTVGPITTVSASVNIPGQNLNNARAVNFAGLYHNGACIPEPICPVDLGGTPMTPSVMVVPVSASGMNDPASTNVYPISSFTAYATALSTTPLACTGGVGVACSGGTAGGRYWRVCLNVVTSKGLVTWDATSGPTSVVMALTRCSVSGEPSGSPFTVWGP